MKLKRLLCALVVFTMVMTSVVCSVSAATYQTTTVYNPGETADDLGTVFLKTTISGLNPGSMVSYIIYSGTSNEAAELKDDGSTISYIDQKTAGPNGILEFGKEAKYSTTGAGLMYDKYTFATSGGETFEYDTLYLNGVVEGGTSKTSYGKLPKEEEVALKNMGVEFSGFNGTGVADVTIKGHSVHGTPQTVQLTKDGVIVKDDKDKTVSLTVHPGTTVTLDVVPQDRYAVSGLAIVKTSTTYGGGDPYGIGGVDQTKPAGETLAKNNIIGGKVKWHLPTINKATDFEHKFDPGSVVQVRIAAKAVADASAAKYIKVDGDPIYETLEDGSKAVTFLMTKSATIADDSHYGINLYAFPANESVTSLDDAEATFENMAALKATDNKFGIQLITGASNDNAKYFDPAKYNLVVVPFYGEDAASAAELSGVDSNASLFYSVDNADLSESFSVESTEEIAD